MTSRIVIVSGVALVGYLLAGLEGAIIGGVAAAVSIEGPQVIAAYAAAGLVVTALLTMVGRLPSGAESRASFVSSHQAASVAGAVVGLLVAAFIVRGAIAERSNAPFTQHEDHRPTERRWRSLVQVLFVGATGAAAASALTSSWLGSVLFGTVAASSAVAALLGRSRRPSVRGSSRSE